MTANDTLKMKQKEEERIDKEIGEAIKVIEDKYNKKLVAFPEFVPDEKGGFKVWARPVFIPKPSSIIKPKK
jgi:hypothetical protein